MQSKAMLCCFVAIAVCAMAEASPAKPAFWKGTPMNGLVEEMRASCNDESDSLACMKLKLMNFLDTVLKKDNYKVFDDVEVRSNGYNVEKDARSTSDIVETLENYLQSHDITVKLPVAGAKVTVSPRNIANDELNVKMSFEAAEERGKKSKLKKVFIPILVFILLKAMTLVPMALGVFGLKAWNALQLSFFSFVISVGLAIFQLCRKLADDHHHHPQIAAHGPWDRRSIIEEPKAEAQEVAYNAYA